jgi:cytochrome c-type biogenesis protein
MCERGGGGLIILFGLYVLGGVQYWFSVLRNASSLPDPSGRLSGLISHRGDLRRGMDPCVGPILTSILLYSSTTDTSVDGLTLLVFYSLGLGLPLLVTTVGMDKILSPLPGHQKIDQASFHPDWIPIGGSRLSSLL